MLLDRERSTLLVVDVQERLAPAVRDGDSVLARVGILLDAARRLGVPAVVSEQYPKGLGHTVGALASRLDGPGVEVIAKTAFSCAREPRLIEALDAKGRPQVVLCGLETHVCVLQTALDLQERGYAVHVAADAVASRDPARRDLGLARMRHAGCTVVDSEMVVFEWLGAAGTDEFKEVSRLIK